MLLSEFLTGKKRIRKKAKSYIDFYGYIMVYFPEHPRARSNGYVLAHYYFWEKYHYACLLKWSRVVHLDKDKRNNSKVNLKAMMGNNYKFRVYTIKSSIST
jgi:hypothetical protein